MTNKGMFCVTMLIIKIVVKYNKFEETIKKQSKNCKYISINSKNQKNLESYGKYGKVLQHMAIRANRLLLEQKKGKLEKNGNFCKICQI